MKTALSFAVLTVLVEQVVAHGYVEAALVDGKYWAGFGESEKPGNTAVLVNSYGMPNYDVYDTRIACGTDPQAPGAIADASPGSSVDWVWKTHTVVNGGQTWTHHEGTKRTFIGKCIGSCGSTDVTQVEWAEIMDSRWGYDGNSRVWAAETLHNGGTWRDIIPAVPTGDYLLRSELTALHYSTQSVNVMDDSVGHGWGTEFYTGCVAVRVSNSNGSWNPTTVMKFPGAYQPNEQWHYNPDFWTMDWTTFGWADTPGQYTKGDGVGGGGNGSGNNQGSNNPSTGSPNPADTSNPTPATVPNPTCKRRRKRSEGKHIQHARFGSRSHL